MSKLHLLYLLPYWFLLYLIMLICVAILLIGDSGDYIFNSCKYYLDRSTNKFIEKYKNNQ